MVNFSLTYYGLILFSYFIFYLVTYYGVKISNYNNIICYHTVTRPYYGVTLIILHYYVIYYGNRIIFFTKSPHNLVANLVTTLFSKFK